jgi:hypothetical protein
MAPLGYDTKDRKITVNDTEANHVRTIFQSYLKLGSLNLLMADLRARGIVTKVRSLKTGQTAGGIPFTRGPLAYLLRNRFYVGEVAFKGETLAGEQPAIIDRELFDAVQAKLNEQVTNHKVSRTKSEALLLGRIYDDRGHRMTPSHSFSPPSLSERRPPASPRLDRTTAILERPMNLTGSDSKSDREGRTPARNLSSSRQAQTIQAHRVALREDDAELLLVRRACSRVHLDQICPHGVA